MLRYAKSTKVFRPSEWLQKSEMRRCGATHATEAAGRIDRHVVAANLLVVTGPTRKRGSPPNGHLRTLPARGRPRMRTPSPMRSPVRSTRAPIAWCRNRLPTTATPVAFVRFVAEKVRPLVG